MKIFSNVVKLVSGILFAAILTACGGGGGNPGGTSSSSASGSTSTTVSNGTLTLALVDQAGAEVPNRTLSQTALQYIRVTAKDAKGAIAPLSKIVLTADDKLATITPAGGLLTDTSGVANFRIAPASVSSSGVVSVDAAATINSFSISKAIDIQINPGTVQFGVLSLSPTTLQKGQSLNVSVNVIVNGLAASSNSVSVVFSTSCGSVSPSSSLVDSTGKAAAVIQTNIQGDCTVTATTGGVSATGKYVVSTPPVAGIQFVSSTPNTIYQIGSPGVNTSIVTFKVVDSIGVPVPGEKVSASLTNLDGGINFCGSPSSATSSSLGLVSFSVCAGTLPTTVQVKAVLDSLPAIYTSSNILNIQSGLPTQRFFSLSAEKQNILGGAGVVVVSSDGSFVRAPMYNGTKTALTLFAADRQGNPVPSGTQVTFVAEGGQLNLGNSGGQISKCVIDSAQPVLCPINFYSQDYRPWGSSTSGGDVRPGRVTILAYADGEEYFIDANNNNRYDAGELFEDLGTIFLDKDENGVFNQAYTNLIIGTNDGEVTYPIPASAMGSLPCTPNVDGSNSVANSCNGKWDLNTKVRQSIVVVFSGDRIGQPSEYHPTIPANKRTRSLGFGSSCKVIAGTPPVNSCTSVSAILADINGNPLPAGATVTVEVLKRFPTDTCQATLTGGGPAIPSTTEPTGVSASLQDCVTENSVVFKVNAISDSGASIQSSFTIPLPSP